jgi:hypothetical protein
MFAYRFTRWMKKTFSSTSQRQIRHRRKMCFLPRLEAFEDRVVPAVWNVTDPGDDSSNANTLRYALDNAAAGDTIDLDVATITLSTEGGTNTTGLTISSNVTIINASGNPKATVDGAGLFTVFTVNAGVTTSISGLTIENGVGEGLNDYDGAGLVNDGIVSLQDDTFSGNAANFGGGIYNSSGTANVTSCTFTGNKAGLLGGGLFTSAGTVDIHNSTFSGNTAVAGGGIYNSGSMAISDSTVNNNVAFNGAGLYCAHSGTLSSANNTYYANEANPTSGGGGAIWNSGKMTATDSTLTHNSAAFGAGLYTAGSTLLNGDLIVGNSNGGGSSDDIDGNGISVASGFNLVGTDNTATLKNSMNNQTGVPVGLAGLAPLANNGGPTETVALTLGSYALGQGLDVDGTAYSNIDQRGIVRPSDDQQGDVGAFQFANPPTVSAITETGVPFAVVSPLPPSPTFSVTASDIFTDGSTSVALSYQWEISTDGGNTFTPLARGSGMYGNTVRMPTLTIAAAGITPSMNGYEYEVVVSNAYNATATSAPATLNVDFKPTITAQPTNANAIAGGNATFTATAYSNPAVSSIQWEYSNGGSFTALNNGSFGGATISGNGTGTLTVAGVTVAMNSYQFEAVFTNPAGSTTTSAATLTVETAPVIVSSPKNDAVMLNNSGSFTAIAGGNPAPTVQWDVSTDGGSTFTPVSAGGVYGSNVTSNALTITDPPLSMSGYEYEAVFSNGIGPPAVSAAGTLTVGTAPNIATNPTNVVINIGGTTSFAGAAGGIPAVAEQWYVNENNGHGFVALSNGGVYSGASSNTLNISGVTEAMNGFEYEEVFTNAFGTATTASATLSDLGLVITEGFNVLIYDTNHNLVETLAPFGNSVTSVQAAVGFVNGGVNSDLVVASGAGAGQVLVYDGITGPVETTFAPYGASYAAGLDFALGNVLDANTADVDIVIAPGGGGKGVSVYNGTGTFLTGFIPFPSMFPNRSYSGGLNLAVGNLNGSGQDTIAIGTNSPQKAYVGLWNHTGNAWVGGPSLAYRGEGAFVSTLAFSPAGKADLVVGTDNLNGTGALAHIFIQNGTNGGVIAQVPANGLNVFDYGNTGQVRVGVADVNGDGIPDIVVATGPGATQEVRVFDLTNGSLPVLVETLGAAELDLTAGYNSGLYVG